jgi:hypothetical protein
VFDRYRIITLVRRKSNKKPLRFRRLAATEIPANRAVVEAASNSPRHFLATPDKSEPKGFSEKLE